MGNLYSRLAQALYKKYISNNILKAKISFAKKDQLKIPPERIEPNQEEMAAILSKVANTDTIDYLFFLKTFLSTENPITADSLLKQLIDKKRQVTAEECQKALELFWALGFAEKYFDSLGEIIYEQKQLNNHHDHLVCPGCGLLQDFNNTTLEKSIEKTAVDLKFLPVKHRLTIYGLCPSCRKKRFPEMALSVAVPGEEVSIIKVMGDDNLKSHLRSIGLYKGKKIKVLGKSNNSLVLIINDSRVALSEDMSSFVLVKSIAAKL